MFIATDLRPHLRVRYRARADREAMIVTGISIGEFGSLRNTSSLWSPPSQCSSKRIRSPSRVAVISTSAARNTGLRSAGVTRSCCQARSKSAPRARYAARSAVALLPLVVLQGREGHARGKIRHSQGRGTSQVASAD